MTILRIVRPITDPPNQVKTVPYSPPARLHAPAIILDGLYRVARSGDQDGSIASGGQGPGEVHFPSLPALRVPLR